MAGVRGRFEAVAASAELAEPAMPPAVPDTILPGDLPSALDAFPGVTVLSLDCFDTLIWRDTYCPRDIFAALPGTTPLQRIRAETQARKRARHGRGRNEVSIGEIYANLLPGGSEAERGAAVAAEIAAEAGHCFAFAPTVRLMREAKSRGMQVVIVSDSYLDARQLQALITQAAGEQVAGLIDRIFSSSVLGQSKSEGLYGEVLRKLKVKPERILHIGDNRKADVEGVAEFGVRTLHLRQFTAAAEQRLRLESAVSAIVHPAMPETVCAYQPHRAALAIAEPRLDDPAMHFGATALGPIFMAFEAWLRAEASALKASHGGTVHWLFLMRDGHLPMQVHLAGGEGASAHAVEISRFTSTAASFTSERAVQDYIETELGTNPATLARQLLIPPAEADTILADRDPGRASLALLAEVRKGARKKRIVRDSRAMAERLAAHVRKVADPQPGDTLMLVDLGYNGSVQNCIETLLREKFGVHVAGRYLLLRETDRPGLDKRGFIGIDHYDEHTLEALCGNVAVIEQLATTQMGSAIDYDADGTPIRKSNDIKGRQSAVRERIQAGCLEFVRQFPDAAIRATIPDGLVHWRRGAASALCRLMFLPLEQELAVIERFEHDVNLGTDRHVALFSRDVAARGMRRRGLFYMKGAERMFLPAELSGQGLASRLTLLAHKRFGLPFVHADFSDAQLSLPVIYADKDNVLAQEVTATATHDGYFLAAVPIGDCRYSVGLRFGSLYEWVQIESACFLPVASFMDEDRESGIDEIPAVPAPDAMEQVAPHLFHCRDEAGFLMVHPPARIDDRPMMLAVVFRPVVERKTPSSPAKSSSALAQLTEAY